MRVLIIQVVAILGSASSLSTSRCDKELIYDYNFNSYGFHIDCEEINNRTKDLLTQTKVQREISLQIKNSILANVTTELFENIYRIKRLSIVNSVFTFQNNISVFSPLLHLKELIIENTRLPTIGNYTFNYLSDLKMLKLSNNTINSIPVESLHFPQLEILEISRNNLTVVNDLIFCEMPNLKEINFSHNNIIRLKQSQHACQKYKTQKHSKKFKGFLKIRKMNLEYNKINNVGQFFNNFHHLEYLSLANNQIKNISGLEPLGKLKYLNLKNNIIHNVSSEVFKKLSALEEVDLSNNFLKVLPFESLINVRNLYLSSNLLRSNYLKDICKIKHLEGLDLSYNNVTYLPQDTFHSASALKSLSLTGNKISLYNNTFSNLTNLLALYLNKNGLKEIPDSIFSQNLNLTFLDLSHNRISSLSKTKSFLKLTNLLYLNISYNLLESLEFSFLQNLLNLKILDVEGNRLKYVPYEKILSLLPSIKVMYIKYNLFSCGFLATMIKYFRKSNITYKINEEFDFEKENVAGIYCREFNSEALILEVPPVVSSSPSVYIFVTLGSVLSVFLSVVVIYKYYIYRRRRAYLLDEIELIGK